MRRLAIYSRRYFCVILTLYGAPLPGVYSDIPFQVHRASIVLLQIKQAHEARASARWTQPYLELLRIARAAADGEGAGHMVPEGGVVGMLLDGHQLYSIVAKLGNPRQHIVCTRPLRWLVT